jgi:hypothetical protein
MNFSGDRAKHRRRGCVAGGLVLGVALAGCSSSDTPPASGNEASSEQSPTDGGTASDAGTDAVANGDAPTSGLEGDAGAAMDSQAGVVTCDGGIDAGASPCQFSAAADGGPASFVAGASNCVGVAAGGGTGALIQFVGIDGQGNQLNLTFRLTTDLTVGQTGTFQASLDVDEFTDGSSQSWSTPGNDCTFVIASDVCAPASLDPNQTLITGAGQCSQPAQSTLGVSPAIDIGAFTFTGLVL